MNEESLGVRLRRASAAMHEVTGRLRESFEEIEDALWDKAMRPVEVPLVLVSWHRPGAAPANAPKIKRRLRWDGEFLLVSVLGRRERETGQWERLTVDVDECDVLLAAVAALPGLIAAGRQAP